MELHVYPDPSRDLARFLHLLLVATAQNTSEACLTEWIPRPGVYTPSSSVLTPAH